MGNIGSVHRTDPMFRKFENARDKIVNYERTHKDRESDEYQKLVSDFKYYDKVAAEVKFDTYA